jgi:hypothetical protein
MAKFYVESGNLQMVVTATSSRGAALWAVHRAMSHVLPFVGDEREISAIQECQRFKLAAKIRVNQRGFERPEGRCYETLDIVREWQQLLVALSRLERQILEPAVPVGA